MSIRLDQVWSGYVPPNAPHVLRFAPPGISRDSAARFIGWLARQLASVFETLRYEGMAHGDVHTGNIMFRGRTGVVQRFEDLQMVLIDFGLVKPSDGTDYNGGCLFYSPSSFWPTVGDHDALRRFGFRCSDVDGFSALQVLFQLMCYVDLEARAVAKDLRVAKGQMRFPELSSYLSTMGRKYLSLPAPGKWLDFWVNHEASDCVGKVHTTFCKTIRSMLNRRIPKPGAEGECDRIFGFEDTETLHDLIARLLDVRLCMSTNGNNAHCDKKQKN